MDWTIIILSSMIIVPASYLIGYKLRAKIAPKRRFGIGFIVALITLTLALLMGLQFSLLRPLQSISSAIAIGFPLGLAGPPLDKRP